MASNRRKFIKDSLMLSAGLSLLHYPLMACNNKGNTKLSILILGGTSFLGPHQVAYALQRGHKVSIFTRGKTKPTIHTALFKDVEQLVGDREDNLSALENRKWDLVIDNSGRKVEWTEKTANLLKDNCGLYLYISSTGVYFPYKKGNLNENDPVLLQTPADADNYSKMSYDYGVMKANSEIAAEKAFGKERTIVVRPTYMIGPGDRTDRFIHWPIRLAKGGNVLVPGKKEDPVQFADVRDVAEWCIRLAENKNYGTYNAVGPKEAMTIHEFANEAASSFASKKELIYVDDYEFLTKNNVYYIVPWIMVDEFSYGSARIANAKALNIGISFRSIKTSIRDTHDWWISDALTQNRRNRFLNNDKTVFFREKEILKNWENYKKG